MKVYLRVTGYGVAILLAASALATTQQDAGESMGSRGLVFTISFEED